jgi:hypothetical protein
MAETSALWMSCCSGAVNMTPFVRAGWIVGVVWAVRDQVLGRWRRALGVSFENVE